MQTPEEGNNGARIRQQRHSRDTNFSEKLRENATQRQFIQNTCRQRRAALSSKTFKGRTILLVQEKTDILTLLGT